MEKGLKFIFVWMGWRSLSHREVQILFSTTCPWSPLFNWKRETLSMCGCWVGQFTTTASTVSPNSAVSCWRRTSFSSDQIYAVLMSTSCCCMPCPLFERVIWLISCALLLLYRRWRLIQQHAAVVTLIWLINALFIHSNSIITSSLHLLLCNFNNFLINITRTLSLSSSSSRVIYLSQ